jgi:hypothetical protein
VPGGLTSLFSPHLVTHRVVGLDGLKDRCPSLRPSDETRRVRRLPLTQRELVLQCGQEALQAEGAGLNIRIFASGARSPRLGGGQDFDSMPGAFVTVELEYGGPSSAAFATAPDVPEPSTVALLGLGIAAIGLARLLRFRWTADRSNRPRASRRGFCFWASNPLRRARVCVPARHDAGRIATPFLVR